MSGRPSRAVQAALALLFALPVLHPLLRPAVGPPSHLLWWSHVLPVAFFTFRYGRRGAVTTLGISAVLVLAGERTFGAGYDAPATWETALSLAVALTFTNVLVAGFALYARKVTARYQILFERMTLPLLRTDETGRIEDANPPAIELLGLPGEDLRERRLQELFHAPDLDSLDALAAEGSWTGRLELAVPEGDDPRPIHAFVVAIRHPSTGGHQVLVADRSVEVLRERELERKSKLASLGEALAGVAHELKNPLTTIMAHAQLGRMDDTPRDELEETLEVVEDQAGRIKELVDELLGFSRSNQEATCTRIDELLARLLRLQRVSRHEGVEFHAEIDFEGEVYAPPNRVEQIVLNLVSNAVDAIEEEGSGGRIGVACRKADDEEAVEVEVYDDGPGIDEEVLPSLFEPFVTTKPEGVGTGLGLAISRRLADSMGGSLDARNRPEGGASFVLRLPTAEPDDATVEEATVTPGGSAPPASRPTAPRSPRRRHR